MEVFRLPSRMAISHCTGTVRIGQTCRDGQYRRSAGLALVIYPLQLHQFHQYSRSSRTQKKALKVYAIGFDLGGDSGMTIGFEKRAANLLRDSKRILVYQAILKTKPAEAFLALLKSLQQNAKDAILSDFSRLYHELSNTQSTDWKNFLLEEVLVARENAWARELSRGDGKSRKQQAAANDLLILQQLALENEDIMKLIREALPEVPDIWVRAALNAGGSPTKGAGGNLPVFLQPNAIARETGASSECIQAPMIGGAREEAKAGIDRLNEWSEATSILSKVYKDHGFGMLSQYTVLQWSKGAFQAFPAGKLAADMSSCGKVSATVTTPARSDLDSWPPFKFVGPGRNGENTIEALEEIVCKYGPMGLRAIVWNPSPEVPDQALHMNELVALFRVLRQYDRMKFLVVPLPFSTPEKRESAAKVIRDLALCIPENTGVSMCRFSRKACE